jgi:two-component system OmpR family response regulator
MRVLIVEDDVKLAALTRRGLRGEGMTADVAICGEDALWMAAATDYDIIVMDVMLPGLDGFATCRELRRRQVWSPVLMLTARDAIEDRVRGLDTGADDYVAKPFSFALLETFMRRPGQVLDRFQLLEYAWDFEYESRSNVVDVYVRYLREKIDRPFGLESLETVRGAGYRLRADGGVATTGTEAK